MSQHHGHYIRRSDYFLQKPEERAAAASATILRSNTAIQVITDGPRHRFHCGDATHTFAGDNTHTFRVRMRGASRSPLGSRENPPKASSLSTLYVVLLNMRLSERDLTVGEDARDWRDARLGSRRGGSDERALAGYRESHIQIMMSKVDRTNALYYVVNGPNNPSRCPELRMLHRQLRFLVPTDELNIIVTLNVKSSCEMNAPFLC